MALCQLASAEDSSLKIKISLASHLSWVLRGWLQILVLFNLMSLGFVCSLSGSIRWILYPGEVCWRITYVMFFSLKMHFVLLLYKMHHFNSLFFLLTCWQSNEPSLTLISRVCRHSFQQAKDSFMTTCYSYPIVPLSALSVYASFFTLDIHCWWAVLSSAPGHLS